MYRRERPGQALVRLMTLGLLFLEIEKNKLEATYTKASFSRGKHEVVGLVIFMH